MSELPAAAAPARDGPEGIGGWLILPTLGILFSPLSALMQIGTYVGIGESFPLLTPAQRVFIVGEAVGILAISFVLPIVLLVFLFKKMRAFPRFYVVWAIINVAFVFVDLIGAKLLFGHIFEAQNIEFFDGDTVKSIVQAIVLVAIWTPYMLQSRRVKNTFVN